MQNKSPYRQVLDLFTVEDEDDLTFDTLGSPFIKEGYAIATDKNKLILFKSSLLKDDDIDFKSDGKRPSITPLLEKEENRNIVFPIESLKKAVVDIEKITFKLGLKTVDTDHFYSMIKAADILNVDKIVLVNAPTDEQDSKFISCTFKFKIGECAAFIVGVNNASCITLDLIQYGVFADREFEFIFSFKSKRTQVIEKMAFVTSPFESKEKMVEYALSALPEADRADVVKISSCVYWYVDDNSFVEPDWYNECQGKFYIKNGKIS